LFQYTAVSQVKLFVPLFRTAGPYIYLWSVMELTGNVTGILIVVLRLRS